MLFHITLTHTADNCPGYNQQMIPDLIAAIDNLDNLSSQFGVKIHFMLDGLPEHVGYALLEAEDPSSVAFFISSIPMKQDFKMTAVEHSKDVAAKAKAAGFA